MSNAPRERLTHIVRQAVLSAINDHGPITKENANSAAKRIAGQLVGMRWEGLADSAAVGRLHKRIHELKFANGRMLEQIERLRARVNSEQVDA